MIAIGVGGLDAATVMAGAPFEIAMPQVVKINLKGKMQRPWVTAMDVILEILRRLTVKGGVGKIMEYGGPGVKDLNVTERATITNMGAELGATTSVFPSDKRTKFYLEAVGRPGDWVELSADKGATYAGVITLDLGEIEPMIAQPHSPDNVVTVKSLSGTRVHQVCIGSCTNSSYQAMKSVASLLKGNTVSEGVNLMINPGSKQVYEMISREDKGCVYLSRQSGLLRCFCREGRDGRCPRGRACHEALQRAEEVPGEQEFAYTAERRYGGTWDHQGTEYKRGLGQGAAA
jgi:aconitate hydratase